MHRPQPFTLRIFVAEGDPDGLRTVERSNWNGRAVMFPRSIFPRIRHRDEFNQTGVYLLIGPRTEGDGDMLYVGEGDPVRPRLEQHHASKDFWTRAVFVVAGPGQLNKAHVQFLEAQLIALAKAAKRMPLDNGNTPTEPTLSEADRADMEVFLHHILGMLPVLGIQAFEQAAAEVLREERVELHCQGKGAKAKGYDTPQGFIVKSGSSAAKNEAPSLKQYFPGLSELRAELLRSGVLVDEVGVYIFSQDYTFNSPSQASSIVLGSPSNGRENWKDGSGRTLKQIQEAQAEGRA